MDRLRDKVAIVTGGATGIGEAISKLFALEGAKVIVCGMPQDPVMEVVEEIIADGGIAEGFEGDVSMAEDAKSCIQKAVYTWGRLDILINNAGVFPDMKELQEYDDKVFDNMLKNNIGTCYMMSKHALPELQKTKGCIVSAGSEAGKIGIAQNTPYEGTKSFIHAFMMGLAVEQAAHGVRANCVCPGAIDTAWTHKETGPFNKEVEQMVIKATPMGRRGTPEEIANAYLFLASDEASYVTGSLFSVDGGITKAKGGVGKKADKSMNKAPTGRLKLKHKKEGATELR